MPTRRKRPIRRSRKTRVRVSEGRGWRIFDWFVVVLCGLLILVGGLSALVEPESSVKNAPRPAGGKIVLQLFNGTGYKDVVAPISDSLRAMGIDVRDEVRRARSVYPYTILLDRKGNPHVADSLALILGLPRDRVILQKNNSIYDVTLVLGKDYKGVLKGIFREGR